MSTCPATEILPATSSRPLSASRSATLAGTLAILGSLAIWPTLSTLWGLWSTDALKSVGMLIPLVSVVLIARAWHRIGWHAQTSWLGLPIMLFAIVISQIQTHAILLLVISPRWTTPLPPSSLPLLGYGIGAVLLIGGTRLLRKALFPTMLLWFANPVPHVFTTIVDLPLQRLSALVARSFAMHLGQALTPDKLRLMFTPEFGMFIAPGCDGLRGGITMAFIALIAAYIYRFRWYASAFTVTGALLLGYVFNLIRLCALVLYYLVALHFPWLQHQAENADYVIGGLLFLFATVLLLNVVRRFRCREPEQKVEPTACAQGGSKAGLFTIAAVAAFGLSQVPAALASVHPAATSTAVVFPQHIGNYDLARTWNETLTTGSVVYNWAEYVPKPGGTPIALGISPVLGWHDQLLCHMIRGEHPIWQGQLTFATTDPAPVSFNVAFYNDGVTQHVEAATECAGGSCGEFATGARHFGFVYRINATSFLNSAADRPVPVLLRAEVLDSASPQGIVQTQLTGEVKTFLSSVDLGLITHPRNR